MRFAEERTHSVMSVIWGGQIPWPGKKEDIAIGDSKQKGRGGSASKKLPYP